jgi:signal transduction histidine kinase
VQEALTNAMRHAPGAPVEVAIDRRQDHLDVRVVNGVALEHPQLGGSGTGLAALADRAALLGGHFSAGATPDGGFAVAAELPAQPANRHPHQN